MRANWARIQQQRQSLAADKPFEKLSEEFETIMDLCKCLQSPEAMPSKKMKRSIKTLMERVQNTSELFDAYQELFFSLGSSMYLTSVHLGAAKFVFSNLDKVKRLCSEGKTNLASFKNEPTRKNYVKAAMKDLTQKAQKVSSPSPRKRSIAEIIPGISANEENVSRGSAKNKQAKQPITVHAVTQGAKLSELCISPTEFEVRLGSYGQYCPVSHNLYGELVDCSFDSNLEFAVEFRSKYYKTSSKRNMETFLANPEKFVEPLATRSLPPPEVIPKRRTQDEAKAQFPKQIELNGYCPVTFCDGKLRYEALVEGNSDLVVEYKEKLYIFQNEEKLEKFMKIPSKYSNLKLPNKLPPKKQPTE
ncbi:unnamed protein product [Clavelina lepadiformis]|uniref:Cilia- and flagella-associated protein 206 n=1 Tax=Clavelina lepadiformis TaxID=159417 RepID=A0ABP0GDT7_CLALP